VDGPRHQESGAPDHSASRCALRFRVAGFLGRCRHECGGAAHRRRGSAARALSAARHAGRRRGVGWLAHGIWSHRSVDDCAHRRRWRRGARVDRVSGGGTPRPRGNRRVRDHPPHKRPRGERAARASRSAGR
jgi:hypothetical protein